MNLGEKILSYIIIILVIAVIFVQNRDYDAVVEEETTSEISNFYQDDVIEALYPDYTDYKMQDDSSCMVYNGDDELAHLICSDVYGIENYGYAGLTPIMIALNPDNKIDTIVLLDNNETPTYIDFITEETFFDSWDGMAIDNIIESDIETVSGATLTTESVVETVNQTMEKYTHSAATVKNRDIVKLIEGILFGVIIFLSLLLAFGKKLKNIRFVYMVLVLIIMGFISKKMLSVDYMYSFISGGFSVKANIQAFILLALAIVIPMFGKPKFYCNYLCPMGALQEVVGKISPIKKKKNLNFKILKTLSLKEIYLIVIVFTLLIGVILPYAKLEPFSFFSISADLFSWFFVIFAAVIIILSVFFNKPYCSVCPTGCTLDTVSSPLKKKKKKTNKIEKNEK